MLPVPGRVPGLARIVGVELVVARIVDAAEGERRPERVALGGVVVDDVEEDLDAGFVQGADRAAKADRPGLAEIARLRREEGEGRIAPVVAQALLDQEAIVREGLGRHQFDRRDAELDEVLDHGRMAERRESAAKLRRHRRVEDGQPLDVRLVDDRLAPGPPRRAVVAPFVSGRLDDGFRHHRCAVAAVRGEIAAVGAGAIAEERVVPADPAGKAPRIGVDQELVRIEAVPGTGIVGAVNAVAVELARPKPGDVAVPDLFGPGRQRQALDLAPARGVEEAEVDLRRMGGEQGEVDATPIPDRAERLRAPFRDPFLAQGTPPTCPLIHSYAA